MKILFVSQYFYPEVFRGNDIAFDLVSRGHQVTVVCGTPNYPEGRFYKGYGWLKRRHEIVNGVNVVRIPIVPRRKGGTFMLLLNYFSFLIVGSIYTFFIALHRKFDCVFVQQLSPVMMSMPGIIYKKMRKVPLYTWVLDLWPESLSSASNISNKAILAFFTWFVKSEYKNSDKILISSKSFMHSICEKGYYADKIVYYPNWAEDVFTQREELKVPISLLPEGFIVMFAGNVGEAQDFEHIMEAAFFLKNEKSIHFVIIGDGRKKEWIDSFVKEKKMKNTVHLLGRRAIEAMPYYFAKADLMLVSLKDETIFNMTVPAKIQAYMQSRKPIIGMINGEGAEIIQEANCGLVVSAGDSEALAKAIKNISLFSKEKLQGLANNGYNYCNKYFNKKNLMNNLYNIINH